MQKDGQGVDEQTGEGLAPALAENSTPTYEADDGPLSEGQLSDLRRIAGSELPEGNVVSHRTLF